MKRFTVIFIFSGLFFSQKISAQENTVEQKVEDVNPDFFGAWVLIKHKVEGMVSPESSKDWINVKVADTLIIDQNGAYKFITRNTASLIRNERITYESYWQIKGDQIMIFEGVRELSGIEGRLNIESLNKKHLLLSYSGRDTWSSDYYIPVNLTVIE